jgi:hypothetical protein
MTSAPSDIDKNVNDLMNAQRNYVCQNLNTIFDESSKKLREMLVEKMDNVIKSEAVTNTITTTIQSQLNSKIESSMKNALERMISESKFDDMISSNISAIFNTSIKDAILLSMQETSNDVTRTICGNAANNSQEQILRTNGASQTNGGKQRYKRRTMTKSTKKLRRPHKTHKKQKK